MKLFLRIGTVCLGGITDTFKQLLLLMIVERSIRDAQI